MDDEIDIDEVADVGEADIEEDSYEDTDNGKTEELFTIKEQMTSKKVINKQTNPYLTKYERTQLIGIRAQQLSNGAIPMVITEGLTNTVKIAEKELNERKIPIIVRRYMPNGEYEDWKIEELII